MKTRVRFFRPLTLFLQTGHAYECRSEPAAGNRQEQNTDRLICLSNGRFFYIFGGGVLTGDDALGINVNLSALAAVIAVRMTCHIGEEGVRPSTGKSSNV